MTQTEAEGHLLANLCAPLIPELQQELWEALADVGVENPEQYRLVVHYEPIRLEPAL